MAAISIANTIRQPQYEAREKRYLEIAAKYDAGELFRAQGFSDDYIIEHDDKGKPYPKTAQVARCGNAVPPQLPAALVRTNLPELCGELVERMAM